MPLSRLSSSPSRPVGVLARSPAPAGGNSRYTLLIADGAEEVRAAQRLRHDVFAGELGAQVAGAEMGLDVDEFDSHCDHLVVRDEQTGDTVGTYRMLPPDRAEALGRRYGDSEFDTAALRPIQPALVETGRSCVHPDHRNGAVVGLMWAGIARYMLLAGHRWLGGCASVQLADGGTQAAAVWEAAKARHLAPPEYRVKPRRLWHLPAARGHTRPAPRTAMPALLRGYLRLGAWIAGPPAHDPAFGVADFYVLLSMDRVDGRYLRHFLGAAA